MEEYILNGVGKKTRCAYLNGKVLESKVMQIYVHNKKEAEAFSMYGMDYREIVKYMRECHNPILKMKLEEALKAYEDKSQKSCDQNKLNLEKLDAFLDDAINGIGLKRVIRIIKNSVRKGKDKTLKILLTLLETEFANLKAKYYEGSLKSVIYERKDILMDRIAMLLDGSDWQYGYSDKSGKNASYLIYVYLPNGVQLSWHSNDYLLYQKFPYIEAVWDSQCCSTMTKILDYLKKHYSHLFITMYH